MVQPVTPDPVKARRELHQGLIDLEMYSKSGYEFEQQFLDPHARNELYQGLVNEKMYSKGFDEFSEQFFGDLLKKKEEPVQYGFPGQLDLSQPLSNQLQGGSGNIPVEYQKDYLQPLTYQAPVEQSGSTPLDVAQQKADQFLEEQDQKDFEQDQLKTGGATTTWGKDAGFFESFGKRFYDMFANQLPQLLPSGREQQRPKDYNELASKYPSYPKKDIFENPKKWEEFVKGRKYSKELEQTLGQDLQDTFDLFPEGGKEAYQMFAKLSEDRLHEQSINDANEILAQTEESNKLLSNVPVSYNENGALDLGYIGGQMGNAIATSSMMFTGAVGPFLMERQDAYEEGVRKTMETTGKSRDEVVFSDLNKRISAGSEVAGLINSVLERASLNVITSPVKKMIMNRLANEIVSRGLGKVLTQTAKGASAEALTETVQDLVTQVSSNVTSGKKWDDINWTGTVDSALGGLFGGGGMSAISQGVSYAGEKLIKDKQPTTKTTPSEKPKEPTPSEGGPAAVPKAETQESVPVQGEQKNKEEVKPQFPKSLGQLGYSLEEVKAMSNAEKGRIANAQIEKGQDVKPKKDGIDFNDYDKLTASQKKERLAKELGWGSHEEMVNDETATNPYAKADVTENGENSGLIADIEYALNQNDFDEANKLFKVLEDKKIKSEQVAPETIVPPEVKAKEVDVESTSELISENREKLGDVDRFGNVKDFLTEKQNKDFLESNDDWDTYVSKLYHNGELSKEDASKVESILSTDKSKPVTQDVTPDTVEEKPENIDSEFEKQRDKIASDLMDRVEKAQKLPKAKKQAALAAINQEWNDKVSVLKPSAKITKQQFDKSNEDTFYSKVLDDNGEVKTFDAKEAQVTYDELIDNKKILFDRGFYGNMQGAKAQSIFEGDIEQINETAKKAGIKTRDLTIDEEGNITEQEAKESPKAEADKIAQDSGFDNASHLINSVKKRTGKEYENVQDIPKEVINRVVNERNLEELPPAQDVVSELESQRENEILTKAKPDLSLKGLSDEEVVKLKASEQNKYEDWEKNNAKLQKLIDCLWKIR